MNAFIAVLMLSLLCAAPAYAARSHEDRNAAQNSDAAAAPGATQGADQNSGKDARKDERQNPGPNQTRIGRKGIPLPVAKDKEAKIVAGAGLFPELADPFDEVARISLLLNQEKDAQKQKDLLAQLQTASDVFEKALKDRMNAGGKTDKEKYRLNQLGRLWKDYRGIRDTVLVPARLNGTIDDMKERRNDQKKKFQIIYTMVHSP